VAASQVLPGPPRRGSNRSIMRFLDRLSDLGARPDDPHDERLRHGTLIFASMVITVISSIWVATYLAYGYPTSAAIPALYQLTTVVGLIVLARTRRFGVFRTTQLLAFLVLPALLQASLGGFVASSAMTCGRSSHRSRRSPCGGYGARSCGLWRSSPSSWCSRCSTLAFRSTRRRSRRAS
jgi:hypothetical protein